MVWSRATDEISKHTDVMAVGLMPYIDAATYVPPLVPMCIALVEYRSEDGAQGDRTSRSGSGQAANSAGMSARSVVGLAYNGHSGLSLKQ